MDIQDHTSGVHTCHRCGWPFPNPHPSPKHRRAHKKICGTIEGYTKLIHSGVVSDDEHHSDEDDKETTPSPKIEKKIMSGGGIELRSNRSEDDLFSDAVTEFSDSGISLGVEERSEKTLDGDGLHSFKDAENAGTTELLDSPIAVKKEDDVLDVFKTPDTHTKDADKTKENDIITDAKITLPESDVKASDPLVKDRDGSHNDKFIDPEPSTLVHTFQVAEKKEKGEEDVYVISVPSDIPLVDHSETLIHDFKDHETVYSNVPKTLDTESISMVEKIQECQTSENGEPSVKSTVPTVITEEVKVPESIENLIEEIEHEKLESDHECVREVVKESEIINSVLVLTKEDLASEIFEEHESGIEAEEKIVESGSADSKDRGSDVISQSLEKLIPEETEQVPNIPGVVSEAVVDEGSGKLITGQDCGVDASIGSSSRNSLEGNWGSVSVLSTASIDAENSHSVNKSGNIATDKSSLGKSDVVEALPLVEPEEEIVDQKASEIKPVVMQTSEQHPSVTNVSNESEGRKRNEEAIAKVTNWSTGKHTSTTPLKNLVGEAKSPNIKQLSTTIQKDEVVEKNNEPGKSNLTSETPLPNQELSPPKYISEGKKARKKTKGRVSWVPFACCSSVNVN